MNIIKHTALTFLLAFSLASTSLIAYAQEEEAAKPSVFSPNEAIMHLEAARVEIVKNDFVPPSNHLKAARAIAKKITGDPDIVKQANACIIQAQIKLKEGDIEGATEKINKTLELYNSL
ncbi:hypothetical protein [Methylobacter sp. BBA5.1]|jgi:hypothetical protein|uniref:hypothetical protein n=1 Tax=Methylobacter sp. BBA5.1 TaxID=1495064 RepID=UPI0005660BD0|nr:hypothetical protein [Methylobacter sp. BBA5.1]